MTLEIALVLLLVLAMFVSFVWERIPPDLTALACFAILIVTGLLTREEAFGVLSNTAPFTVGAMFVISAALVKTGGIDRISALVQASGRLPYPLVMLVMVLMVAAVSAFVNNTPVVVVFLPVVLSLARKMQIAPSKLLIPLSYAAVLGGCCTLIGTSTNLVVNGIMLANGQRGFSMLELAWLGVPATLVGAIYLALAGNRLLPKREMLTSILSDEERREYITEAFVQPASPMLGKTLRDAGLTPARGVRVLEIVRRGVALYSDPALVTLEAGDRLILACRPQGIAHTRGLAGVDLVSELNLGLEQIAAHEGSLVEAVVTPHASIVGHTVREVNFRQRFRMVVLALHRKGRNVREQIDVLPIQAGDVLLMMGTDTAIDALSGSDELVIFDRARVPARAAPWRMALVVGGIAAVVGAAAFEWMPIEVGALIACVVFGITRCIKPAEAYAAIEWNILFLIYAMLAVGVAMEKSGAAAWIAGSIVSGVEHFVPVAHQPIVMLASIYLVTTIMTEVLSNNAVAALMTPIVLGLAVKMGVDPRPLLVAVTFAASAAFATPIGYQTNTYVYGVGGYRFSDFLKVGIPLNIACFVVALVVIPRVWPF